MSWIEKNPNATSVTFHLIVQGFWADTLNMARLQNCPDITILVCHGIVSGVTHAVGHAVAHGVYRDIVHVVCHGASHAVNWGSQNFLTLTVQHLLHGHTNHIHISSSTPSVTSTNTTFTITSTNQANVYSEFQLEWMICHTVHMGATSLQYEWANEYWCFQSVRIPFCILCNCMDSLHCDGVYMLFQTLSLSVWLFALATRMRLLLTVNE